MSSTGITNGLLLLLLVAVEGDAKDRMVVSSRLCSRAVTTFNATRANLELSMTVEKYFDLFWVHFWMIQHNSGECCCIAYLL